MRAAFVKKCKVTLYVRGVKTAIGTKEVGKWGFVLGAGVRGGYRLLPDFKVYSEAEFESVLPDDQKRVVDMVEAIAHKHGFEVEIIDVTKEGILHRIGRRGLKVKIFPTLITGSGEKIEGKISKGQIEFLLTKAT